MAPRNQIALPLMIGGALASGLVLGWVLGGIGPRADVLERDEQIAALSEQVSAVDRGGWRSPVPGLDRILREPPPEPGQPFDEPSVDEETGEASASPVYDGGVADPGWRARWRERSDGPLDRLTAFRRAASVQEVRRVQSRAALQQQADLSQDEMVEVDRVMQTLNDELQGHAEELILLAMGDEPPPARDLLGITHDVTGILSRAQLDLESIVGAERMEEVEPSALEIWNYIDLDPLEPAARAAVERAR